MGGCSAMNCSHHSSKGHRILCIMIEITIKIIFLSCYVFPADEMRRKLWLINCRRANWVPGRDAALCEVNFIKFILSI